MALLTIFAGKQGRTANQPQDDPTTHVSPVNVHQNRNHEHAPPPNNYANTDPNVMAHQAHQVPGGDAYSAADVDNRNRGVQAHNAAAHQAEKHQKKGNKKIDQEELKRMVAEENESKGKLPRYPGLERWQLVEKMGDGAFSNVYRARDLDGEVGEVAIKVVRKFEMNSNQVSILTRQSQHLLGVLSSVLFCAFEKDLLPTSMGDVGRCSPASGFQEATQGRGGAH